MGNFLKIQRDRAKFLYHGVRNWWPIWYLYLNRESRRVWHGVAPKLSSREKEITAALERNGIAVTHIRDLFPSGSFEELLRAFEEKKREPALVSSGSDMAPKGGKGFDKKFMKYFWGGGGTNPTLEIGNPFIQFALNETILRIVGTYLGSAPKFHGFSLQETVLVPPGETPYLSQRWHRDPDDKKICKVFIYLNDVPNEGSGPFMYVKGSQLGGKWRNFFPQRPPVGRYPDPGAVEKTIPIEDRLVGIGTAGTMIFCDTSGLHRGGYSTEKIRSMFAAGFASKASVWTRNYTVPSSALAEAPSPLARYALQ